MTAQLKNKKGLTIQQTRYVRELASGKNKREAAVLAGYSSRTVDGAIAKLNRNDAITRELERIGLTDTALSKVIKQHIDDGIGIKSTADTSLKATELALKLKGYLTKEDTNNTQTNNLLTIYNNFTNEELVERVKQLQTDIVKYKQ